MSSTSDHGLSKRSPAENIFYEAFSRLKNGAPIRLPKGTLVSQNNVAREAGRHSSALKRERYPRLVKEIQDWVQNQLHTHEKVRENRSLSEQVVNRELKEEIARLKVQRDRAESLLVQADAYILTLVREISELKVRTPSNVIDLNKQSIGPSNFKPRND